MHDIIHLSKHMECTISRLNSNINYGLLVGDVDNEGYACVETLSIWETSGLSAKFAVHLLKNAVKKSLKKNGQCDSIV